MEPSRSALWMTQSPPHSQDSELTINYEAEPSQTVTFLFFVTAFFWVSFLGLTFFSDHTTLHLPLPHSQR